MYSLVGIEKATKFDFVLIDGPPKHAGGREATLPTLIGGNLVAYAAEVWLDDASRREESSALDRWEENFAMRYELRKFGGSHGVAVIKAEAFRISTGAPSPPRDMIVTIAAGGRPNLLRRSLESMPWLRSAIWSTVAKRAVLCRGDAESATLLRAHGFMVELADSASDTATCGETFSTCAKLASDSGKRYWLHLEDDWIVDTLDTTWLTRGANLLDGSRDVVQVRLRHAGQRTGLINMATGQAFGWRAGDGDGVLIASAHCAYGPALMRAPDGRAFVADSERAMAKRVWESGRSLVARIMPGAFVHVGDGESLREITKCKL